MTPRPYLSWSQFQIFERSPKKYAEIYLFGGNPIRSTALDFGSKVAEAFENGEHDGVDPSGIILSTAPLYELREYEMKATIPIGKRKHLPLLGKFDTIKKDFSALLDHKTGGKPWTQRDADKSEQLTFYAMIVWAHAQEGKIGTRGAESGIPDLGIVWLETRATGAKYEPGDGQEGNQRELTGRVETFHTKRTIRDILEMIGRASYAWEEIEKLTDKYLL
ncbi:MAG: PD-(D/E)XK nuclease family protein [Candidatus Limnocylindrales bacterium]